MLTGIGSVQAEGGGLNHDILFSRSQRAVGELSKWWVHEHTVSCGVRRRGKSRAPDRTRVCTVGSVLVVLVAARQRCNLIIRNESEHLLWGASVRAGACREAH